MKRTSLMRLLALMSIALLSIGTALAQSGKPIRILVGFPAGGGHPSRPGHVVTGARWPST